jgi:hypothetical protein
MESLTVKDVLSAFTFGNTKLKKDGIATFGLPPVVTCPNAGTCKSFCYASTGNFRFPSVAGRAIKNHEISQHADFATKLTEALRVLARKGVKLVRIHQSGDFYSIAYIKAWFNAFAVVQAEGLSIEGYAYTKSFGLIVAAIRLTGSLVDKPSNLTLIASEGGTLDAREYVSNFPQLFSTVAIVKQPEAIIEEHFVGGSESDLENLMNAKMGLGLQLPAHGAKRKAVG